MARAGRAASRPSTTGGAVSLGSESLFILYTSGSTGKAEGHLAHDRRLPRPRSPYTHNAVFDLKEDTDAYWCTADIGWVQGHSYVVYGPLADGATAVMYRERRPTPRTRIVSGNHRAAPRHDPLHRADRDPRLHAWAQMNPGETCELDSLRLLGTVGEPDQPRGLDVVSRTTIGNERCPIVDTWWQTETGRIMIVAVARRDSRPSRARCTKPAAGIMPSMSMTERQTVPGHRRYTLVISSPGRRMLRTIWGDDERYQATVLVGRAQGITSTGDGARHDTEGYYWIWAGSTT